jgi:hypothetical protein
MNCACGRPLPHPLARDCLECASARKAAEQEAAREVWRRKVRERMQRTDGDDTPPEAA